MPKLTDDQIREIAELREAGWSDGLLADRFEVSKSTINWHCLMLGVNGCAARPPTHRKIGPMVTIRNGREVRRFSNEDDAKLIELAAQATSRRAIAREMGRNPRSIVARLAALARREEQAA